MRIVNIGKKRSKESSLKKSIALKGRKKNPESVKKSALNRRKKVFAFNEDTKEKISFNSVNELCEHFKDIYSSPCIRRYLSGKRVPSIQNSNWRFDYEK